MKTLKLRIKDKHYKVLDQLASEVNFVWNYVNDLGFKHRKHPANTALPSDPISLNLVPT